jgi:hypothetical protein
MRGKKSKELKRTFRLKYEHVLLIVRHYYGEMTKYMTENMVFNKFKQLYKKGLIPKNFMVKRVKGE